MRFEFPNHDLALGFADGLADPDGLDVYASVDGNVLEILGLDDHPMMVQIEEQARELGALKMPESQNSP